MLNSLIKFNLKRMSNSAEAPKELTKSACTFYLFNFKYNYLFFV